MDARLLVAVLYVVGALLTIGAALWAYVVARSRRSRIDRAVSRARAVDKGAPQTEAQKEALAREIRALGGGMELTIADFDQRFFAILNERLLVQEIAGFWRQGVVALLGIAVGRVASVWALYLPAVG